VLWLLNDAIIKWRDLYNIWLLNDDNLCDCMCIYICYLFESTHDVYAIVLFWMYTHHIVAGWTPIPLYCTNTHDEEL